MAKRIKLLFLHGWFSSPGSSKKEAILKSWGYLVHTPELSGLSIELASSQAQEAFGDFRPDVVVGSSRGGAIAMNLACGEVPRVLLAPAYKFFRTRDSCSSMDVIVHGTEDQMVNVRDSRQLAKRCNARLIEVEAKHPLNCSRGRGGIKKALEMVGRCCS